MLRLCILAILIAAVVCGREDKPLKSIKDVKMFLVRFGYLSATVDEDMAKNPPRKISDSPIFKAIAEWQRYNNLEPTGQLDDLTLQKMNNARCANRDAHESYEDIASIHNHRNTERRRRRRKRANIQGSKWIVTNITWKMSRYPPLFHDRRPAVLNDIQKAFQLWSDVTPLNFIYSPKLTIKEVHIDIRFDSGCHGDEECHDFDGKIDPDTGTFGNTLAHAFYPQWGGDVHFDEDEEWTVNNYVGCNIFIVGAHEIGHALGLNHSSVPGSLMQPIYPPYRPNHDLHDDDIIGIQTLYGSRRKDTKSTDVDTSDADSETLLYNLCVNSEIDGVGVIEDTVTVFKDKHYYKLIREGNGVQKGFPRRISTDFAKLEGPVDAVMTATRQRNYIFKNDKFWKFRDTSLNYGYPKNITDVFKGVPSNIDAAFQMESGGQYSTYLFKGDEVWKFTDPDHIPPAPVAPQKIYKVFPDLPSTGIDGAFQAPNKMIYAFRKSIFWRLDDSTLKISDTNPQYPRDSALWFFGCRVSTA